ncbi:hypothetical protein PAPHI01_0216 [Pancytospora philotis]|nr:hypothetical protein PAPHI01_0216 [Pancytospora philotis]
MLENSIRGQRRSTRSRTICVDPADLGHTISRLEKTNTARTEPGPDVPVKPGLSERVGETENTKSTFYQPAKRCSIVENGAAPGSLEINSFGFKSVRDYVQTLENKPQQRATSRSAYIREETRDYNFRDLIQAFQTIDSRRERAEDTDTDVLKKFRYCERPSPVEASLRQGEPRMDPRSSIAMADIERSTGSPKLPGGSVFRSAPAPPGSKH